MADTDDLLEPAWWNAWRGIVFAHARVFHAVERDLKDHSGVSLPFMDVLGRLYDAPEGRLRMQDLHQQSLFTHSGLTRVVDRIEAQGLVRREEVPGDRRGVRVAITPEGKTLYEGALVRHRQDVEREFGSRLTPDQYKAVATALWGFWHD